MTVLSLTTKEEATAAGLEIVRAQREDIDVDDETSGGYRKATAADQAGKIIARSDSKELRRRGILMPGVPCYCTALMR